MNKLEYGMGERFVEKHHGVWWVEYDPVHILRAMESGPGNDEKYDELIQSWKTLQDSKEVSFGNNVGRNYIDLDATFPPVP